MDNAYKLILIVLTFFLALTFVQSSHALEPKAVIFSNGSATLELISPNPLPSRATPEVSLLGPFSVVSLAGVETTNKNGTASISAVLRSNSNLRASDVYSGKALIRWGTEVHEIPLRVHVGNGSTDFISPLSGFFILPAIGLNIAVLINIVLVIVIIFLVLGLAIRLKKRLEGN